jgi:tetratricopeptide (TPR) repeat protein
MWKRKKIAVSYGKRSMLFNCIKKPLIICICALFGAVFAVKPSLSANPKTIILLPFVNEGGSSYTWVAAGIYDYLARSIHNNSSHGVIPPSDVLKISEYLGIKKHTPLTPEKVSEMTALSGADEAVSIRYFVSGDRLYISIEMIPSTGGTVRKSFSINESISRIFEIEDALYRGIVTDESPVIKPLVPIKKKVKGKWVTVMPVPTGRDSFEWYAKALEASQKDPEFALSLFVKTLRYDPENTAALVSASKIVHDSQGNLDGALGYLLRADRIFLKRGESSTTRYALLMIDIADIYYHKQMNDRSNTYISRAFDAWKKRKNMFSNEYASFLSEIGTMYFENGNYRTAADYFSMVTEVYSKNGSSETLRNSWVLCKLGESLIHTSSPVYADRLYQQADEIYNNLSLTKNADYAQLMFNRGKALYRLGNVNEASERYEKARLLYISLGLETKAALIIKTRQEMSAPLKINTRD